MFKRLTGWQRLWVVLSGIWLIIVGFFAVAIMPKAHQYERSRLNDSIEVVGRYLERENPGFRYEGAWDARTKYYADLTDDEVLAKLHEKYEDKVNFAPIETQFQRKNAGLLTEQAQTLGLAFLVWLIPAGAVYVLGLAVGWIMRGFRQSEP